MTTAARVFVAVRDGGRPSLRDVAAATGITHKQAKHALQRLRHSGWIAIDRETKPAVYYAIREGVPTDGRGMAAACAIGRQKRAANLAKAPKMCGTTSPWKFPPVPELERLWPRAAFQLQARNEL